MCNVLRNVLALYANNSENEQEQHTHLLDEVTASGWPFKNWKQGNSLALFKVATSSYHQL